MKKDDGIYLKHILGAISRIEEYVQDLGYEDFIANHLEPIPVGLLPSM